MKKNNLISQEGKRDYSEKAAEETKNISKGDDEFNGATRCAKKRSRRGNAHRGKGTWTGKRRKKQTILRRRRKKKIRKGISSSRRQPLSGEVAAG